MGKSTSQESQNDLLGRAGGTPGISANVRPEQRDLEVEGGWRGWPGSKLPTKKA